MATGNTPAVSYLMNLMHHNAQYSCHHCFACDKSIAKTMCFLKSKGFAPIRDVGSICRAKGSIKLLTFISSAFFGQDEIHLLGHRTGHQLYQALGDKFCPGTAGPGRKSHSMHLQKRLQRLEYPFALNVSLDDIKKAVSTSRADILMAFTIINHLCFTSAKQAVRDLVLAAIGHWHSFLRCKILDGKLKSNIFVMNQHMLVQLGFILWEMGPLWAYSCRLIERTISTYTSAIKSSKEPGKNMENVLFWMAAISHCCGNRPVRTRPADRRTSNFEVASDDVAGPQLWSREGVSSFEEQDEVICTTKMWKDLVVYRVQSSFDSRHVRANNLIVLEHIYGFVCKFFSHTVKGVTRLFAATESLFDIRPLPGMLFPVSSNRSQGEMCIVDVKSIKGMADLVHDTKDGAIRHIF
ncbi:hypothetical protein PHYBLDRAFT_144749 [Phycomyces blakesleeanus NRRL 1555(-)]|uniref:Uncharacterized protein n=1 Tax=Phycomyces blakesleeanus (strain ATCC 8743b / DSM 1359 / FGSC 10004 / NBRC 33097 / NRRL 1555) TaxID=763407 RepID=A0A162UDI9_PHYB8|nr:hypothetical protein PHYBLDRAFT_144749 [Phycomyces blakesleeanus NRRL 1555(-)]OAD74303.1 hypothetical protein PHYBLDRAFT_144749 [Phycomyces blakesleeanus NRRL 1555(-)]|eukprot:XP_018292343.1 hypothetical protein PHYBLDRAFT_144749 [Phycomyces blakesleeanus NRRL 1555(-)]